MMFDFSQMQSYQQIQQNGMFPAVQLPTVADVEKFQPQRGMTMVVMAQDKPVFALKTANGMGVVNSNWYKYESYDPAQDKPKYVTMEELERVLSGFAKNLVATAQQPSDKKSTVKETQNNG